MEAIRVPNFVMGKEDNSVLTRLQLLSTLVNQVAADRAVETDVTVPVMKVLADLKHAPGVSCLNGVFDTLKDLVFQLHDVSKRTKKLHSLDLSEAKQSIFSKDASKNLGKILHLQGLLKTEHKKCVDMLKAYALELHNKKGNDSFDIIEKIVAHKRTTLADRELVLRDQLKTLSIQLAVSTETQIRKVIENIRNQLIKVAESAQVSRETINMIKFIKPGTTAHQIYLEASDVYTFPSRPTELVYCSDCHDWLSPDPEGGRLRHLITKTDLNTNNSASSKLPACCSSGIYMRATEQYKPINGRALKTHKGDIVKAKVFSADKLHAFGWKKTTFGMKVWGYFSTSVVTPEFLSKAALGEC